MFDRRFRRLIAAALISALAFVVTASIKAAEIQRFLPLLDKIDKIQNEVDLTRAGWAIRIGKLEKEAKELIISRDRFKPGSAAWRDSNADVTEWLRKVLLAYRGSHEEIVSLAVELDKYLKQLKRHIDKSGLSGTLDEKTIIGMRYRKGCQDLAGITKVILQSTENMNLTEDPIVRSKVKFALENINMIKQSCLNKANQSRRVHTGELQRLEEQLSLEVHTAIAQSVVALRAIDAQIGALRLATQTNLLGVLERRLKRNSDAIRGRLFGPNFRPKAPTGIVSKTLPSLISPRRASLPDVDLLPAIDDIDSGWDD